MSYLSKKQKVSMSYNHSTKEFSTCITEGSTYLYNNKTEKATKTSKIMFKRYMDTNDENLNDKENIPIIEIPVTDELSVIDENVEEEEYLQEDRKVRFASHVSNLSSYECKEPTPDNSDRRLKTILKQTIRNENAAEAKGVHEKINETEKPIDSKVPSTPRTKTPSPKETPKSKPRSSSLRPPRLNFNECSFSNRRECKHINVLFDGKCLGCGISVTTEEAPKKTARRKLSTESINTASSSRGNNKENIVAAKPVIQKDTSDSSDDLLNRTYTISPKPPTPPRVARQRRSRQGSIPRKSPMRTCKHRILDDDGSCSRCKIPVNSKMYSATASPIDPEKAFTRRAFVPENKPSPKSTTIESLPWPLPSRKELAPFTYVNQTKGRFIIQKDTEVIYEALMDKTNNSHVKYIFRVSKEGPKQTVTVCSPKFNQLFTNESSSPVPISKVLNKFTNLGEFESQFPGCYKHICKALKIISGRVPRIECRNTFEIKHLCARIMINGDFRLILPNNKIFYHKYGTPDDQIVSAKNAEFSILTPDERNIFNKAREFIRDLDQVHRRTSGPNYHGIIVHASLKSENDSMIDVERVKSPTFLSNVPSEEERK